VTWQGRKTAEFQQLSRRAMADIKVLNKTAYSDASVEIMDKQVRSFYL
jgi:hypothetical protein